MVLRQWTMVAGRECECTAKLACVSRVELAFLPSLTQPCSFFLLPSLELLYIRCDAILLHSFTTAVLYIMNILQGYQYLVAAPQKDHLKFFTHAVPVT